MRSVEEILAEAKAKGLRLNNLFELPSGIDSKVGSGVFQANFHHMNGWHDYGRGPTPNDALQDALDRCRGAKGPDNRPIPKTAPKPVEETSSLDDML